MLSTDRGAEVQKLLPGTEDHFFFSILVKLNADPKRENHSAVSDLLAQFKTNYPHDHRITTLEAR